MAATGNAQSSVEMRCEDENLCLTQKMVATLYGVSVPAGSQHLKRICADNELEREATVKPHLMVQTEGERDVQRKVDHYSLQAKNDLTEHDMAQLQRRVSAYLVVAQDRALRKIPMTMQHWESRLNRFIDATDREVL